jgi:hypothetical protein
LRSTSRYIWVHAFPANLALLHAAREAAGTILPAYRSPRNYRSKPSEWRKHLTRILFVGQKPETVDFSDSALPQGFDAEKINAGIAVAVAKIGERGWQGDTCMITLDEAGRAMLEKALKGIAYYCVVSAAASGFRQKAWPCSRWWSTPSIRQHPARQSHSTRAQRTLPKLQPANSMPANRADSS